MAISLGDFVAYNNSSYYRDSAKFDFISKINKKMITIQYINKNGENYILGSSYSRAYPQQVVKVFNDHPYINSAIIKVKDEFFSKSRKEDKKRLKQLERMLDNT